MAVVNTKSTFITNADASPAVLNNPRANGGFVRSFCETVETANGDSIASVYRFFRVRSNARPHDLKLYSDDIGTTTIADFGVYRTAADGGAVVDADLFSSAVSLKDGALNGTDILHESGVIDVAEATQELWQLLGLSTDPGIDYDVCATLTAAADAAGTITLKGLFSV